MSSVMYFHVVWQLFTDILEETSASIFMVEEDKQMETVVSSETLVNNIRSQKMVIFEICDNCTVITFAAVYSYLQ